MLGLVRGLGYYLRYFCLFAYSGVQHILCSVCLSRVFCVPNVANFSGLSILYCYFSILKRLFTLVMYMVLSFSR